MKEKVKKIMGYVNDFIQSDYYIVFYTVLTFLGWMFDIWVGMFCALLLLTAIPLFLFKDTKHVICFLMMFIMVIGESRYDLGKYMYMIIPLVVVLAVAFIFSVVRFKRDWSVLAPKNIKGFWLSLFLMIIPFLLAGAGRPSDPNDKPLVYWACVGLITVVALGHSFLMLTNTGADKKKLLEYMLKVMFATGLLVSIQLIIFFARQGGYEGFKQVVMTKGSISVGWAGPNNIAPVLALTLPAPFYLCVKKSKLVPFYVAVALTQWILIMLTGCRGVTLFATLAMPFMCCFVMRKTENKYAFGWSLSILLAGGFVVVAYYSQEVMLLIQHMTNLGLDDNSRIPLYHEAIGHFKQYPLFGVGWDYKFGILAQGGTHDLTPRWYHSMIFQAMSNMGLVGLLALIYLLYWRYRAILAQWRKVEALAVGAGILLFDLYGLIDINFFSPTFFIMMSVMVFTLEASLEPNQNRAFGSKPIRTLWAFIKKHQIAIEPNDE